MPNAVPLSAAFNQRNATNVCMPPPLHAFGWLTVSVIFQNFGLFTPDSYPQGQRNPQTPVRPETPTRAQLIAANRSTGQRRRRERERLQGSTQVPYPLLPTPPQTQTVGPAPPQTGGTTNLPIARRPYQEPPDRHDLGRMDRICVECGALHWLMERSTAPGSSNSRTLT